MEFNFDQEFSFKMTYFKAMQSLCAEIPDEVYKTLHAHLDVQFFKRKAILFRAHQVQRKVGFVISGLVHAVYLDGQGMNRTSWFIDKNEYVTDYPCFLNGQPSTYSFEALEDTIVVFLPKDIMDAAYESYPAVQKYGRLIAEYIIAMQHSRIEELIFMSAKERYIHFLKHRKLLANRISQSQLASFLGIERQSLVRIRKEMLQN